MIYLHVSYGNPESGNWERFKVIPLIPYKELYPGQGGYGDELCGLNRQPLELPGGETIALGVAFWSFNNSVTFVIEKEGVTLLNLSAFKKELQSFDPSVVFRSPSGVGLSFMFSSENA